MNSDGKRTILCVDYGSYQSLYPAALVAVHLSGYGPAEVITSVETISSIEVPTLGEMEYDDDLPNNRAGRRARMFGRQMPHARQTYGRAGL